VIFSLHDAADDDTLAELNPQGAWVDGLDRASLKSFFACYCDDLTLEEAFEHLMTRELPTTINARQIPRVVASSIDADVFEALEDPSDGLVSAVSFREVEHGEDVLVQTKQLL